jgi:hypothetical protein
MSWRELTRSCDSWLKYLRLIGDFQYNISTQQVCHYLWTCHSQDSV